MEVTQAVFDRVESLMIAENNPDILGLRISIVGGGCSGFQYQFSFADEINEDDTIVESESDNDLKIVIDPMSMMYLEEATVDYVSNLQGEYFSINNPSAKTSCGCGSSFAV